MRGAIERLPKWAQDEILRLDKDVEFWKERALTVLGKRGRSQVRAEFSANIEGREFIPLPDRTEIIFFLGESMRVYVRLGAGGSTVSVRGDDQLRVEPTSSNCLDIGIRPKF